MPYLQLEVNESYRIEKEKLLAKTLGDIFHAFRNQCKTCNR